MLVLSRLCASLVVIASMCYVGGFCTAQSTNELYHYDHAGNRVSISLVGQDTNGRQLVSIGSASPFAAGYKGSPVEPTQIAL
ncbi:MAG TPA: hypothetical protein PKD64_03075, partial [Pirellulaceae bacterium]|nr:hypothetical protein [Pirellulaceae bacterium]